MKTQTKSTLLAIMASIALAAASSSAHAYVKCPGAINDALAILGVVQDCTLDRIHAGIGNPLDNLVRQQQLPPPGAGGRPSQPPFPMQVPTGNFCHTPAGRFGPGPLNYAGAPCHVFTPYGPVFGNVGM